MGETIDFDRHPYGNGDRLAILVKCGSEFPGMEGTDDPCGEDRVRRPGIYSLDMCRFALFSDRKLNQDDLADLMGLDARLDDLGRDGDAALSLQ